MSFVSKIDKRINSSKARSNSASNSAPRSQVADSPLMQRFKAGKSLIAMPNNLQENAECDENRHPASSVDSQFLDIPNGSTSSRRKAMPWMTLNRKASNPTSSTKSIDSVSMRSGSKESGRISESPKPYVFLLEMTYTRVEWFVGFQQVQLTEIQGSLVLFHVSLT